MTPILKYSAMILAAAAAAGCSMFKNDDQDIRIAFGTVTQCENNLPTTIDADDGSHIRVASYLAQDITFRPQDRIAFNYTILKTPEETGDGTYRVRINDAQNMPLHTVILQSFIGQNPQHRNDSIGNDPIEIYSAWTAGKYLNLAVGINAGENYVRHIVNVVADDTDADGEGATNVYVRHNAYGENSSPLYKFYVSFDMGAIADGPGTAGMRLHWKTYSGNLTSSENLSLTGPK